MNTDIDKYSLCPMVYASIAVDLDFMNAISTLTGKIY